MKNIFLSLIIILFISCNSSAENKETTQVENAVERIPEKVEDAVEVLEELPLQDTEETIEKVSEAFTPPPFIANILEQLGVQPIQVYDEFIVQKVLPYDTASSVVVIPTIASLEDDGYSFSLNSYILVVDSVTGVIKQQFYEKESWYSDAIRIAEITIDTANYKVKDDIRAFGIELFYIGASNPNPYNSRSLSLFIKDKDRLLNVLDAFETHSHGGEWDMRCTGEFITTDKILIMDSNQTEGFFDIIVRSETDVMKTFEKGEDDCEEKVTRTHTRQILKYKNGAYQIHKKEYTLDTESSCGLQIKLEGNQYFIKTNKREHAGTFVIEDGYITFKGLLSDDPKKEVEGSYHENEIVIQNYGNAMNPFTVFGECGDQKYLHLVKNE